MTDLALILLPGLDGSGAMFRPLLRHLPPGIRPVVVAYPLDKLLGYNELLPLVLAALPRSSPFVLLGESFSGPLALMAAAIHPQGLQAVVLCATFVRNPVKFRPGWLRHFARPLAFRLFPKLSRIKAMLAGYLTPELRGLLTEALADVTPQVLAHRVREVLKVDVVRELVSCPVPILYLRGDRDRVVPGHNVREIVTARPSVEVAHIPAPHHVLQTQPALAAAAISGFIGRQTTGMTLVPIAPAGMI
ncbi:MAG: alpha/beta hydrolase [Phycisphaerales bacterium]|nr:alpha/beta hydrolase [Phycisphaerales bacterium]